MPDINNELGDESGSNCFCGIYFCSGYWQLQLDEESQPLHAFRTPLGAVKPTRTTQGGVTSAEFFQQKVERCFGALRKILKSLTDDFMMYASSETKLLSFICQFLEIYRERNLVISLPKSTFSPPISNGSVELLMETGIGLILQTSKR